MPSSRFTTLEPLEARIAPANAFPNPTYPLPDVVAGPGQTGTIVDLSQIFDTLGSPNRTILKISTNFDADPSTAGIQGDIYIELYDDLAPLTVQNFLAYAFNRNANGDYDGTFFHRLAEGFVLQGGGYQTSGKNVSHIDTLPSVHNEFDSSRSNLRGTIALAKTGAGPNTGTSEWFINLADNSENLDNQNGGFTVFARVLDYLPGEVDGMEVVDAIAALPTYEVLSGSGFLAPVQGFDPASGKKPAKNNLILIDDVKIIPAKPGNTTDLSYTVEGVKKVEGGILTSTNSDLLTHTLDGSKLTLNYVGGKAGVAEVTVKISKSVVGENGVEVVEVLESFFVTVQPNLVTHVLKDNLQTALIPGDTANIKVQLLNNGGAVAQGLVDVKFYLIAYNRSGSPGNYNLVVSNPEVRVELNTVTKLINIGSGLSGILNATVQIPTDLSLPGETFYKLGVEVTPAAGFNSAELFTDDNSSLEGNFHQIHNRFGSFTTSDFGIGRTNAVLTYTETDGDVVQLTIKGKGTGKLVTGEDGIVDLELSGTTAATKVIAKVISTNGDGDLALRNIDSVGVLGSLQFGRVDVAGDMAFTAGVKNIILDQVTGPGFLSIGLFAGNEAQKTTLSFGSVRDLSIDSVMPINSLTAREWLNTGGAQESILTPGLGSLTITGDKGGVRGDFEANLDVTDPGSTKTIRIAGLLNESVLRLSGNVKSVSIGGMVNSSFLVGANDRPASLSDFTEFSTVTRFAITGVAGVTTAFVNSTVAADTFRSIAIRGVDGASGDEAFGVVANTIGTYSREGAPTLKKLTAPGLVVDKVGNYQVTVL